MARLNGDGDGYRWTAENWTSRGGRKYSGGPSESSISNADKITVRIDYEGRSMPRYITMHGPWDDLDIIDDIVDHYVEGYEEA